MAYVKTVWIDDETVISAASLNKIENKLFELDGISTNLKQEDSRINQKIADEVANRQSEITSVNAKIGVLETKSDSLAQSDALINSRIDSESQSRKEEDDKLFSTLVDRDNSILSTIAEEKTNRQNKDTELSGGINANSVKITGLEINLTNSQNSIAELEDEVLNIDNRLIATDEKITTINAEIEDVTEKVNTLIEFGASQSQVDDISERLIKIEEILSNLNQ